MPVQPQYLEYVLEQLAALGDLRPNRMFGGVGLYCRGLFFGLIDDDTLYFKTGEDNIADYRARNMPRFMPFPERTDAVLGYHQVPADVIEDPDEIVGWAKKSVAVALAARARKARPPKKTARAQVKAAAKRRSLPKRRVAAKPKGKAQRKAHRKIKKRGR